MMMEEVLSDSDRQAGWKPERWEGIRDMEICKETSKYPATGGHGVLEDDKCEMLGQGRWLGLCPLLTPVFSVSSVQFYFGHSSEVSVHTGQNLTKMWNVLCLHAQCSTADACRSQHRAAEFRQGVQHLFSVFIFYSLLQDPDVQTRQPQELSLLPVDVTFHPIQCPIRRVRTLSSARLELLAWGRTAAQWQ